MAARMKKHQDLYKQLRYKSLQVYAANLPGGVKSEKTDAMQIRLAAYLWVWDDFYEEGLWQTYENNSKAMEHTQNSKNQDLLVKSVESTSYFKRYYARRTAASRPRRLTHRRSPARITRRHSRCPRFSTSSICSAIPAPTPS